MDSIHALKLVCTGKPYTSFSKLPVGDYVVEKFEKRKSPKYGDRIRVELQNEVVYLPERFNAVMTPQAIAELNASTVIMSFKGRVEESNNFILLDFDVIDIDELNILAATQPSPPPPPPPPPQPPMNQQ